MYTSMTALCLAQCLVCIHALLCGLCPVTVAVMLVFVCSGAMQCCNTDVLIHACVYVGDCFGFFNNETVLYQPAVHPCPPPVFASLLTFPRMKWRLVVPETGGRAAGLNTRRSQRYATALSEPLKLTGCQKTTLPMLRPPKLTLLWPISRNSIPSQSPDLRSPKRDNSSPWKKELDEDAQIVRGREGGISSLPSARFCLFLCLTSL